MLGFRNDCRECLRADGKDVIGGYGDLGSIPVASNCYRDCARLGFGAVFRGRLRGEGGGDLTHAVG